VEAGGPSVAAAWSFRKWPPGAGFSRRRAAAGRDLIVFSEEEVCGTAVRNSWRSGVRGGEDPDVGPPRARGAHPLELPVSRTRRAWLQVHGTFAISSRKSAPRRHSEAAHPVGLASVKAPSRGRRARSRRPLGEAAASRETACRARGRDAWKRGRHRALPVPFRRSRARSRRTGHPLDHLEDGRMRGLGDQQRPASSQRRLGLEALAARRARASSAWSQVATSGRSPGLLTKSRAPAASPRPRVDAPHAVMTRRAGSSRGWSLARRSMPSRPRCVGGCS